MGCAHYREYYSGKKAGLSLIVWVPTLILLFNFYHLKQNTWLL